MPGLFSRLKSWIQDEKLLYSDLNAEFNNIINKCDTDHIGGASTALASMQATENPGGLGSESVGSGISATDEIERLRFVVQRMIGGTSKWYESPAADLSTLSSYLSGAGSSTANRIVSGAVNTHGLPTMIWGKVGARTAVIKGLATPIAYSINGSLYSLVTDVTAPAVSAPPATNNTAVTSTALTSTLTGFVDPTILTLTAAGANVAAQVGKWIAMSGNGGYIIGYLQDVNTLTNVVRYGWTSATGTTNLPIGWANPTTLTLQRIFYIFLTSTQTAEVCETNPSFSVVAPSAPAFGDMWFDVTAYSWKKWNGSAWLVSHSILLGTGIATSADCVAAKSVDFQLNFNSELRNDIALVDNVTVTTRQDSVRMSVYGRDITQSGEKLVWKATDTLLEGGTVAIHTVYYLYVTPNGGTAISQYAPVDRRGDLGGWYHLFAPYRCLGMVVGDGVTAQTFAAWSLLAAEYQKSPQVTNNGWGSNPAPFRRVNIQSVSYSGVLTGAYTDLGSVTISPNRAAVKVYTGQASGYGPVMTGNASGFKILATITTSAGVFSPYQVCELTGTFTEPPPFFILDVVPEQSGLDESASIKYTIQGKTAGAGTLFYGFALYAEAPV